MRRVAADTAHAVEERPAWIVEHRDGRVPVALPDVIDHPAATRCRRCDCDDGDASLCAPRVPRDRRPFGLTATSERMEEHDRDRLAPVVAKLRRAVLDGGGLGGRRGDKGADGGEQDDSGQRHVIIVAGLASDSSIQVTA